MTKYFLITITALVSVGFLCFTYIYESTSENLAIDLFPKPDALILGEVKEVSNENKTGMQFFDVGTRFSPITKESIINAKTFEDFLQNSNIPNIMAYTSLDVIVLDDDTDTDVKQHGSTGRFTEAQKQLLHSLDYSTNLKIRAEYTVRTAKGTIEAEYATPHVTIAPAKGAKYLYSKHHLLMYLENYSKDQIAKTQRENLKPGKLYFTISKTGSIKNIHIPKSCGYPEVDNKIKALMTTLPGTWEPAKDTYGQAVDQTLVISYGQLGC